MLFGKHSFFILSFIIKNKTNILVDNARIKIPKEN